MLIKKTPESLQRSLISKIVDEGRHIKSRYGDEMRINPTMIICKNPSYTDFERDFGGWKACGESYLERVENLIDVAVEKLKKTPYSRRVSIPIWKPEDHKCNTPPAITEVSFLYVDGYLHGTAYMRSLDAFNYFEPNINFITFLLESVCRKAEMEMGSIAMIIGIPHIYFRDLSRVERGNYKDYYGIHELGTHLKEDYMSTAWHSALEAVYFNGKIKKTEWGELFEGQEESKFIHRLFIEIQNLNENRIHDKAPFTKKYGIEYAHEYVIYAKAINRRVSECILKEGETYTYAERARFCERDKIKVDQLYTVLEKLRQNPYRRDCYIGISREWDLKLDEPPCLRGYQFLKNERFAGLFYLRSNDVYGAMHANMYAFSLLTEYISELLGFENPAYYHFALDAHIYSEFLDDVKEILMPSSPKFFNF